MFDRIKTSLRRIAVLVSVASIALLSQGGPFASELLHRYEKADIAGLKEKLLPFGVNLLIGVLVVSIAYLFYRPLRLAVVRTLDKAGASQRGRMFLMRGMQLSYWGIVAFVFASIVAPEVLSKLFLGASILSAAIVLSLKDAAADLVGGVQLNTSRRLSIGDQIEVVGMDKVKGKVTDIGYLSTQVKTSDGVISVPNKDLASKPIKIITEKPASTIIMPPGYDIDRIKRGEINKDGTPVEAKAGDAKDKSDDSKDKPRIQLF